MTDSERIVIIGASLAGARAADFLRREEWPGQILLIGDEPELPYERPPLSKTVLLGKDQPEVAQLHDQAWYDERNIELRLGTAATAIDTAARTVTLADGTDVGYDKLLIATGSRVRKLDVPGADLPGVHYLRTAAESKALSDAYAAKPRVVVVGAGWIGLETAATARERGCEVTVVEPQATALASVMGQEIGDLYAELHRSHGVELRFNTGVEHRARRGCRDQGGQPRGRLRHSDRAGPADLRTGHLRRWRRGPLGPPGPRPLDPRRALAERDGQRQGSRPGDGRQGRLAGRPPILLQRPVRPRHGVHG
jgi:NAD(P)H-nitrite reductase large subunit